MLELWCSHLITSLLVKLRILSDHKLIIIDLGRPSEKNPLFWDFERKCGWVWVEKENEWDKEGCRGGRRG